MEFPPPPQEGYDPKLQQVVHQLGADDLAVAAEAAATVATDMRPPQETVDPAPAMGDSLSAFSELNRGEGQMSASSGMEMNQPSSQPEENSDGILQPSPSEQYEGQYTSTDVPVPPMMEWNNDGQAPMASANGTTPAPANQTMDLHSPLHAPAQAPAASINHNVAEQQPVPAPGEPIYTSYAIPPGNLHQHIMHPGHPPAPHAAMAPHPYDPNAHHYAQWPVYASPQGAVPPYAAAPPPPRPVQNSHHNSNFWLQEEEERFLLGLRLYGWGQWKRIQTVVQTRSNKQIKSHAQKREKVNPDIKFKYAKGKSRRGRISAKVEGGAQSNSPYNDETNLALDDPSLPPMEELWKDVYGTNNGVGPNSRLRRYRSNALHQKWLEEVADKPECENQVATEKNPKEDVKEPKKKLTPEGQYIYEHKVLERPHQATHHQQSPPPMYYNPPPPHYHPGYVLHPPPGVSPARLHPAPGQPYPPPPAYHNAPPMHHVPPHHSGHTVQHAPVVHKPAREEEPATPLTPSAPNEESLRPGMRVYGRNKNGAIWSPGIIYSAKVDPNKAIDTNQASVPLVYHVQYDAGEEDPEVQEEYILSKSKYETALDDLEAHYDLIMGRGKSNTLLEAGTPVYAQWMDRMNPTSHARWLPGTVGSIQERETASGKMQLFHILFDNASEKTDVTPECVLDRNEYHELVKHKNHYQEADQSRMPIGEIYNLFSRGDALGGQGMDLLFTASQMAAPMDTKKRAEPDANVVGEDPAAKRIKIEEEGQQQHNASEFTALI